VKTIVTRLIPGNKKGGNGTLTKKETKIIVNYKEHVLQNILYVKTKLVISNNEASGTISLSC
jgi:hypothetical protein